jgi:Transcription factor TFIIB repeat
MYSLIKKGITIGKDPSSLAATAIYLASRDTGENISQKNLAAASGKSEVTIRMQLKELNKLFISKSGHNHEQMEDILLPRHSLQYSSSSC